MQATGEFVAVGGEFAPGVQFGEDHLYAGQVLLGVPIHRHAAAIVLDLQGTVAEEHDLDCARETGDGLVHAVVDHLLGQMVGPGGIRVHAGAPAHRVESAQDFDGRGIVAAAHGRIRISRGCVRRLTDRPPGLPVN